MLSERELSAAVGTTAYDADGEQIGTVEHFLTDDRTGEPTWVAVLTGLFGTRQSVAPALDATFPDGRLRLPVTAEAVRTAPRLGGEHLDPAEEAQLRRHYGLDQRGAAPAPPADTAPAAGTSGAMTRREEQLRVGTERAPATRVRLVKYVVTEEVQLTVPVRREEIRVEEVPVDAPDDEQQESLVPAEQGGTARGAGLPDEIVLHSERPVLTVEVVPTERVRLRTEVVEGQERVSGQVQRERIAVEQTPPPGGTAARPVSPR